MQELAVVLASGGLDSSVVTAIASRKYRLAMLHISYKQRTFRKELQSFHAIADHFSAEHRMVLNVDYFQAIGGSCLTDPSIPVPVSGINPDEIPISYVPFRNANLLSIAVSWAEVLRARKIFIGVNEMDSSGYPDCRKEFIEAFNRVIRLGTRPETDIQIETPLIAMSKRRIVLEGHALHVPFEKTWSCYQDDDMACGICDSCRLRLKGFEDAGITDPIPYRNRGDI